MAEDGTQPPAGTQSTELSSDEELRPIQLAEAKNKQEQQAATARKNAAEADKAKTEAESAAFAAAFPKGTAKPREGKVEIEGKVGLVGDLIAHSMTRRAAEEIRNDLLGLLDKDEDKVLLVSSPDLIGSDWPYMAIVEQLHQHKLELEQTKDRLTGLAGLKFAAEEMQGEVRPSLEEPAMVRSVVSGAGVGKILQAGLSAVNSFAEIAALFRADYKINARDVSIGSSPLLAAVAHFLVGQAKEVNVEGFSLLKGSQLFQDFTAVANLRLEVQRLATELKESTVTPADRTAELEKEARKAYLEALTAEKPPGEAALGVLRDRMRELHCRLDATWDRAAERAEVAVAETVLKNFDSFATSLLKPPEEGYPPLIAAAIRERLHAPQGYTHVLYAGTEAAGGETITRSTFLRTSMRSLGGAQVSYLLWSVKEERLLAADSKPFLATAKLRLGSGFIGGAEAIRLA